MHVKTELGQPETSLGCGIPHGSSVDETVLQLSTETVYGILPFMSTVPQHANSNSIEPSLTQSLA